MAFTGAEFSLGFVDGFNRRERERKAEALAAQDRATAAEDRARRIKREDSADTFTQEQRDQQRSQWSEEAAQKPQRDMQRQLDLANLRAKSEREGALDFLYDVDAGDVGSAVNRYNSRGTSKIDPASVKVNGRNVQFTHSDTDGDGKPDTVTGNLDDLISRTERTLGREPKKRYTTVPKDASVLDERTGKIMAQAPGAGTAAADRRPIRVGPNDTLVDPNTRAVIPVKRKARAGGEMGGRGLSKFNPERYNADVQGELARLVGGSYDTANLRMDYGQASKKMPPFSRVALDEAARINTTMPGAIPAQTIAAIVADEANAYDDKAIREKARARAMETIPKDEGFAHFGLGRPNAAALKKAEDAAVGEELQERDRPHPHDDLVRRGEGSREHAGSAGSGRRA